MPRLVSLDEYGVNEDPGPTRALVPRTDPSTQGVTYGVEVEAVGEDLGLAYHTAGICVGGLTPKPVADQWLLVDTGVSVRLVQPACMQADGADAPRTHRLDHNRVLRASCLADAWMQAGHS